MQWSPIINKNNKNVTIRLKGLASVLDVNIDLRPVGFTICFETQYLRHGITDAHNMYHNWDLDSAHVDYWEPMWAVVFQKHHVITFLFLTSCHKGVCFSSAHFCCVDILPRPIKELWKNNSHNQNRIHHSLFLPPPLSSHHTLKSRSQAFWKEDQTGCKTESLIN